MNATRRIILLFTWIAMFGCNRDDPAPDNLTLTSAFAGTQQLHVDNVVSDVPVDQAIALNFSKAVDRTTAAAITLLQGSTPVAVDLSFSAQDKTVVIFPKSLLQSNTTYSVNITSALKAVDGAMIQDLVLSFNTVTSKLVLTAFSIGGQDALNATTVIDEVPLSAEIVLTFSAPLDPTTATASTTLRQDGVAVPVSSNVTGNQLTIMPATPMLHLRRFQLNVSNAVAGANDEPFEGVQRVFYTTVNDEPVMPVLPNDEDNDTDNSNDLLSVVQQQTFRYFWEFGHPVSGMARERNTSGDVVTSGGSGFAIMALVVGMERNFITRAAGVDRLKKIVGFLETADRFHGAWSHWINGATGDAIPFSARDNGGDLVETSFLMQGLITVRQYLSSADPSEAQLRDRITSLYESVEWEWYRKQNEDVLYWHWSPDYGWEMNFPLYGYFEEQITYLLAASSPTHGIPSTVYANGYGMNGDIVKNQTYYGHQLPLGAPSPLFWVHYSYLGLDPHFSDAYANYWQQNVSATRINQAYCIENPKNYVGYSDRCWGLTSSDNASGYDAHSPTNDKGVIAPTAALSSFPYTPQESMKALRFFYYTMGDRLWGEYGFYDAFNLTDQWTATSYLAIDQGPIIVMIENYRTGLIWQLFMSAPEVQDGINELNFVY